MASKNPNTEKNKNNMMSGSGAARGEGALANEDNYNGIGSGMSESEMNRRKPSARRGVDQSSADDRIGRDDYSGDRTDYESDIRTDVDL